MVLYKRYGIQCTFSPAIDNARMLFSVLIAMILLNAFIQDGVTAITIHAKLPQCKDRSPLCKAHFKQGWCTGDKGRVGIMRDNCPQSCGWCDLSTTN
ncbi:hypothetical protein GCK32_022419 [Trichostrongylus colubriformis]|uniref:ShKT domain-containing protein n=1 Tax=Trichostrongylus colubriformis TaxID=6319 RepID=A0AAN8GDA2_TRICO